MGRARRVVPLLLVLLAPLVALGQERPDPRQDLEALGNLLGRAVDGVSHPGGLPVMGGAECRGYRIEGIGVVFVLPPRALQLGGRVVLLRGRSVGHSSRQPPPRPIDAETDRQIALIEAQADELTREAARARQDAERALEQVSWQIRTRLAPPARDAASSAPASVPPAPAAPAAPQPPAPPTVPAPTAPVAAPPLPPAPPWSYWFEGPGEEDDERSPDAIVAEVKEVVTRVMVGQGARLRILRPEEQLIAAVDFVDGILFGSGARPERTLVVRVKKRDLDERQAGRLSTEELRKRIEYLEY